MQIFFALSTGSSAPAFPSEQYAEDEISEEKENVDKYSRESLDKQLNESLDSTVVTKKTDVTWDDVAGLAGARMELQIATELPLKFPQLFRGKREQSRFILLYGPPGTGKGHLIKALASGVNSTLFTISSSDIQSKWAGESERLVNTSSCRLTLNLES
jgi:vacuolar protein-sorting-associated protein 4